MKRSLACLLVAALGACKSPSTYYDREVGLKEEELGMGSHKYGSGDTAFEAMETSAIGPCFVSEGKAFQASEKALENAPDRWQLFYTSQFKDVPAATIASWNKSHASGYAKALVDEDSNGNRVAALETKEIFFSKDAGLTRREVFRTFAREVREFNIFLESNRR